MIRTTEGSMIHMSPLRGSGLGNGINGYNHFIPSGLADEQSGRQNPEGVKRL